jgi:hypothetical protein
VDDFAWRGWGSGAPLTLRWWKVGAPGLSADDIMIDYVDAMEINFGCTVNNMIESKTTVLSTFLVV